MPQRPFFFYRGTEVFACRLGEWKAHFITQGGMGVPGGRETHDPPLLYNLYHDPSERFNVESEHPEIIKSIILALEKHKATFED